MVQQVVTTVAWVTAVMDQAHAKSVGPPTKKKRERERERDRETGIK